MRNELNQPVADLIGINDEAGMTVGELMQALNSRKALAFMIVVAAAAAALGLSFLIKPKYKAEVLLAAVEQTGVSGAGLSTLAGEFGGLASVAGLSLGGGGGKQEAIATLQSRTVVQSFLEDHNLLPLLFKSKWDTSARAWKKSDRTDPPTLWDGQKYFRENVYQAGEDRRTNLINVVVEWDNPTQASEWANELVSRANEMLRKRALDRSQRKIDYLERQLEKTTILGVREALTKNLEKEFEAMAITQGADEYAFRVIDPAVSPSKRSWPDRRLFVALGMLLGLLIFVAYVSYSRRSVRSRI